MNIIYRIMIMLARGHQNVDIWWYLLYVNCTNKTSTTAPKKIVVPIRYTKDVSIECTVPRPWGIQTYCGSSLLLYLIYRWHMFPPPRDIILLALSSSACEMLLFIKGRLQILQEQLASTIFNTVWKNLAQDLNKCIYEEVRILCIEVL